MKLIDKLTILAALFVAAVLPAQAQWRTILASKPPTSSPPSSAPVIVNAWKGVGGMRTIAVSPSVGDTLLVFCGTRNNLTFGIVITDDGTGGTVPWTQAVSYNSQDACAFAWRTVPAGGISNVTVLYDGNGGAYQAISVLDIQGANSSSPIGAVANGGSSPSTGSLTTTYNNSLVVAGGIDDGDSKSINQTGTVGTWALLPSTNPGYQNDYSTNDFNEVFAVPSTTVATSGTSVTQVFSNAGYASSLAVEIHP